MTIVPGASRPSNRTSSRGIGEATGCNWESSALADDGAVPAPTNRAAMAAHIKNWRMSPSNLAKSPDERASALAVPAWGAKHSGLDYGRTAARRNTGVYPPGRESVD